MLPWSMCSSAATNTVTWTTSRQALLLSNMPKLGSALDRLYANPVQRQTFLFAASVDLSYCSVSV